MWCRRPAAGPSVVEAGELITSPRAFVATVTTRLAINELRSARARRERYVGEWLPEPIITDGTTTRRGAPSSRTRCRWRMLVLLESLSPEQRAALLLHDVFGYGYARSPRSSEERGQRPPAGLPRPAPRRAAAASFPDDARAARRAGLRFFSAVQHGDLAGLEALLAADVVLTAMAAARSGARPSRSGPRSDRAPVRRLSCPASRGSARRGQRRSRRAPVRRAGAVDRRDGAGTSPAIRSAASTRSSRMRTSSATSAIGDVGSLLQAP